MSEVKEKLEEYINQGENLLKKKPLEENERLSSLALGVPEEMIPIAHLICSYKAWVKNVNLF